ncbi:MAG: ORF6N domain-containing protein [Bacteroidaceae bacterium]|nr:ORF6N domain-containing protein [Bacteroidaceae bacterium]
MLEVQNTIQQQIYEIRGQRVMIDRDLAALYGVETKKLNQAVKRNASRFEGDDFMFQLTKNETAQIGSRSQFATLNSPDLIGVPKDFDSSRSQIVTLNNTDSIGLPEDMESLRSQFATSNKGRGFNVKYLPYAFTELGVAMLSSVLRSEIAINVNREIMRAFVTFRHLATQPLPDSNVELRKEVQALRDEMNEILADQNDINEDTRAQLDAISQALAELQARHPQPIQRKKIGFIQDDKE